MPQYLFIPVNTSKVETTSFKTNYIYNLKNKNLFKEKYLKNDSNQNLEITQFMSHVKGIHDECFAPSKHHKLAKHSKPWFTFELKKLLDKKNIVYRKFKKNNFYKDEYEKIKKYVSEKIKSSKNCYFKKLLLNSQSDSKNTWNILQKILGKNVTKTKPIEIESNEKVITGDLNISNAFNNFFSNISGGTQTYHVTYTYHPEPSISLKEFQYLTSQTISKIIINLKNSSNHPFIDFMPINIFKETHYIFLSELTDILNNCLENSVFPDMLKESLITPIFKSGVRKKLTNYRPISILSIISKILEKYIFNQINIFLNHSNILYSRQYGFTTKKNTTQALSDLLFTVNKLQKNKNNHVVAIFLDFKKAFDLVSHSHLIYKLYKMGIRGNVLKMLHNYLSNRKSRVKIGNVTSQIETVTSGVPQGSLLGPMLFNLFINDMHQCFLEDFVHFADDTVILFPCELQNLDSDLYNIFNTLQKWLHENFLELNYDKTKIMIFNKKLETQQFFRFNKHDIYFTETYKYLGFHIDNNLKYKSHTDALSKKLNKFIPIFYHINNKLTIHTKVLLFNAFILSNVIYGIEFYSLSPKKHFKHIISKINKLSKIFFKVPFDHNDLVSLFTKRKALFCYKEINFYTNNYFQNIKQFKHIGDINTRNNEKFILHNNIPTHLYDILKIYNSIPNSDTSKSFSSFKHSLGKLLHLKY